MRREAPKGLILRRTSDKQVWRGWEPSRKAAGYNVFRNGVLIASTLYGGFTVSAYDWKGNHFAPLNGFAVVDHP